MQGGKEFPAFWSSSYWYGFKANQDVYNLTLDLERVYLYMGKMFCNYQEIFF